MRWAEKKRREWICDFIAKNGFIGRAEIMKEFGIGPAQASIDLRKLQQEMPMLLQYDLTKKHYVIRKVFT